MRQQSFLSIAVAFGLLEAGVICIAALLVGAANHDGITDGIVGGVGPLSFDLSIVCGPGGLLSPALLGCLLGLPVAVLSALRRRRMVTPSPASAGLMSGPAATDAARN